MDEFGYSEDIAQQLQDQHSGLRARPLDPEDMIRTGTYLLEHGLTKSDYEVGQELVQKGSQALQRWRNVFSNTSPDYDGQRYTFDTPPIKEKKKEQPLIIYNPETGERRVSFDNGKTWQTQKINSP
jgi:hypothetical protein